MNPLSEESDSADENALTCPVDHVVSTYWDIAGAIWYRKVAAKPDDGWRDWNAVFLTVHSKLIDDEDFFRRFLQSRSSWIVSLEDALDNCFLWLWENHDNYAKLILEEFWNIPDLEEWEKHDPHSRLNQLMGVALLNFNRFFRSQVEELVASWETWESIRQVLMDSKVAFSDVWMSDVVNDIRHGAMRDDSFKLTDKKISPCPFQAWKIDTIHRDGVFFWCLLLQKKWVVSKTLMHDVLIFFARATYDWLTKDKA